MRGRRWRALAGFIIFEKLVKKKSNNKKKVAANFSNFCKEKLILNWNEFKAPPNVRQNSGAKKRDRMKKKKKKIMRRKKK